MKILGVETQSSVKKKLSVMVPRDVVRDTLEQKTGEFQKKAKLPGFRKGKVPESIVKDRFREDIKYEAELDLIDHSINEAIEQAHIKAVGSPVIEKTDYTGDGDFTYTVLVENIPEVSGIEFKGIELKKLPVPPVTDEQVNEALAKIQKRLGVLMPVEEPRPLREKDLASIKLTELDEHGKAVKVHEDLLWAVDEKLDKDMFDHITGMLVGEKRTVPAAQGKKRSYRVELKAIKYVKYPPVDDDLAKTSGSYGSLEELKSALKKDIEEEIRRINRLMYQDMVVSALIKKYPVELPSSLVRKELEHLAAEDQELKRAYVMNDQKQIEDRIKQLDAYIRIGLVTRIFFDAIKNQEQVAVNEDEVKAEITTIARQNNDTPEHMTERLEKENKMETIQHHLLNDKILDLIIENAQFIEERTDK